jgi:hypothetical protein
MRPRPSRKAAANCGIRGGPERPIDEDLLKRLEGIVGQELTRGKELPDAGKTGGTER